MLTQIRCNALWRSLAALALISVQTADAAIKFRLPLGSNSPRHYYYDHSSTSGLKDFKCGTETYNGHTGTDFSGLARYTPIYAAHQGTIIYKTDGYGDGYVGTSQPGNIIMLRHDSVVTTLYGHMQRNTLTGKGVGGSMACGEKVGGVGTSGNSSGLHLHFHPEYNRVRDDPYAGCSAGSVSAWVSQAYNSEVVGTGCQNAAPSAPSALIATVASASQINLKWTDNSGIESGFKVERATSSAGPFSQIATTAANDVTYSATGLASGTKYFFRVRAYNSAGNSGYSNKASATTKDVIPAAPTSLTATAVSDVQINLAWAQAMTNEDGFRVYRSTDGTNYTLIATLGINAVSYNNTGLTGNRKFWYKVHAFNTAGNSAASNVASDTTAPQAPSVLTATAGTGASWNTINLAWTDNANAEVGFKIERGTALAGPFTQIATNASSDVTYTDTGLAANATYFYRVRTYNANGNSAYSNTASSPTGNAPPVLGAVGSKTVAAGQPLAFTATATDPNASSTTTTWQTFQSFGNATPNETILFNKPANSSTTSGFIDTSVTNYTSVYSNGPSTWGAGNKAMKTYWSFKSGVTNNWLRLNTANTPTNPNPTIALDQRLQFKIYATHTLKVGIGVRETGTTAAYGANGGITGPIEWVGVSGVVGSVPLAIKSAPINVSTTLVFNIPFESQWGFTGDGVVPENNVKGTLEHILLGGSSAGGAGNSGVNTVWFDDFAVVAANNNAFTLDSGAPAGAAIGYRTGKFAWTPTTAQVGTHAITVRVTDRLGGQDFETVTVTVTGTGNDAPVLTAVGNKTVKEQTALTFTAAATDPNVGQTLAFTLDSGAPSGATISSPGAFSWTPTEAQGPGNYPITVRVTDNGSPSSNDFEIITVAVSEVNVAPALAAIASQTVNEGATLSLTASATDSDVPAGTLTYSLDGPSGMTINASSGAISWTPTEAVGPDVIQVTVGVVDNGIPALSSSRTFSVTVNEVNIAPTLTVATSFTDTKTFADFELFEDSLRGLVMFRAPSYSSTTSGFLDATSSFTSPSEGVPDGNDSFRVLQATFGFKTGTTNPWLRLTTFNGSSGTYYIPNPTIDITKKLRFDVWTDKSVKIALGIRETGTTADIGMNGGFTGAIEWVGATAVGSSPNPSRAVLASNWTTLEFNLPTESVTSFNAGNGVLASATGKAVLEHLAVVPNGGMGAYNVYFDNFQVVGTSTNLAVNTDSTITLTNSATDPDLNAEGVKNTLTFSLDPAAPTNAVIDPDSGVFTWTPTPAQSPSTNIIPVRVTDDGNPALSDVKNLTVRVNKVNTAPIIGATSDSEFVASGETVEYQAQAVDRDLPADILTFSLVAPVPAGATINASTGLLTWNPPAGTSTNLFTIRVTDNGVPPLYDEMDLTIVVMPTNTAPVISLGNARITEPVITFETFAHNTANEYVMFNKPANSSSTSAFIDTTATNYTRVSTSFPAGNSRAGAKVMTVGWSFKTGFTDYWVRLNTYSPPALPNPTINASGRLKFDLYTTKALKLCVAIRETGTTAQNGANGGTTGTIEFVGATSKVNNIPQCTRTINAAAWTTVEFDLPNDPKVGYTGDGILSPGQQVLEHLSLVGAGGTGAYTVYLDNFEVVTTPPITSTLDVKSGSTITLSASGTDAENNPLTYILEEGAPTNSTLNTSTGAFAWTPGSPDIGITNDITIVLLDAPTNGAPAKQDSATFTVAVAADTLAPQSTDSATFVASGDTVVLAWDAIVGTNYIVQYRSDAGGDWVDLQSIQATASKTSVPVLNEAGDGHYRIVEDANSAGE